MLRSADSPHVYNYDVIKTTIGLSPEKRKNFNRNHKRSQGSQKAMSPKNF